ncbi:hypothetical protein BDZ89DRAFT_939730 [Hymenopellis radicata]|nr:hypothetical protein BDZ89DRAFT_939730 [Hymenopellis radicata]
MATANNQIALTNTFQSSLSKIPPFLQKLYKIVSDPATDHVIAWSEDGNSFYIHDQATLEAEVLPRWFKTNKTAAFVRQLNKYGFRKVTHLQQGVLKRESEMESSQYVHPDFHRGREDQLAMINEGKKQIHVKESLLVDSIATEASTSGAGVPALRQTLDVNAVVSDIRRNQARITQELTELKQTDRALWDEAHRSLQRYQQQQNTINLIVQFLGNLLGQMGTKDPTHHDSHPHVPVPVQQQRLMIEDKRRDATTNHHDQDNHEGDGHNTNARIMEVTDEDEDQLFTMDDGKYP